MKSSSNCYCQCQVCNTQGNVAQHNPFVSTISVSVIRRPLNNGVIPLFVFLWLCQWHCTSSLERCIDLIIHLSHRVFLLRLCKVKV